MACRGPGEDETSVVEDVRGGFVPEERGVCLHGGVLHLSDDQVVDGEPRGGPELDRSRGPDAAGPGGLGLG